MHPFPQAMGSADSQASDLVYLTAEIYAFMTSTEAVTVHSKVQARVERFCQWAAELAERCSRVAQMAATDASTLMQRTGQNLHALRQEMGEASPARDELRRRWRLLGNDYEALVAYIRKLRLPIPADVRLGQIKPRNYARNLFHVGNGLFGVALYEFFLSHGQIMLVGWSIFTVFVAMDISRRVFPLFNTWFVEHIFGKISRPNEAHRIPTAVWYMLGLAIGVTVLPQKAIEVGVLILAFADPAAALAGKRWGVKKLVGDKSLVGSLAFVGVGCLISAAFLWGFVPGLSVAAVLLIAMAASVTGALAELFSERVDDNLTIPLVSGSIAAVLLFLLA